MPASRACRRRLNGAREIGFTVVSITVSLIAVFAPLLFMSGILGLLFHEFAVTLSAAIVMSALVSLTLTRIAVRCDSSNRMRRTSRRHVLANVSMRFMPAC